jgi:glycerol-3-phosphate O-acyltransferase
VPVTLLWGREPGKQDSVLKALFAETWQQVSTLRHLFAILIHGRHTVVRFNNPISLREVIGESQDEARALRKIERILRVHFRRQREMALGPDLSHRRTQLHALLARRPCARRSCRKRKARRSRFPRRRKRPATMPSKSRPITPTRWCARSPCSLPGSGIASTTASRCTTSSA